MLRQKIEIEFAGAQDASDHWRNEVAKLVREFEQELLHNSARPLRVIVQYDLTSFDDIEH